MGDCLNFGCVPSKALLSVAHKVAHIKNSVAADNDFGISISGEVSVDFGKVMERLRCLRARIAENDSAKRFSSILGVDVFLGTGKFTSSNTITIVEENKVLKFKKATIATGGSPAYPQILGLNSIKYYTNETIFNLTEQPKTLLVIGSGPVGVELAQSFARLGTKVTLTTMGKRVLSREEEDASLLLEAQMQKDGVNILKGVNYLQIKPMYPEKENSSEAILHLEVLGSEVDVETDMVLLATSRKPN